jgi:hypothetical protein
MRRLALALMISLSLLATDSAFADVPTRPAGAGAETTASLPLRALLWARSFRGNPVPLGILTGAVLLVALGLGAYTIALVYRRPADAAAR